MGVVALPDLNQVYGVLGVVSCVVRQPPLPPGVRKAHCGNEEKVWPEPLQVIVRDYVPRDEPPHTTPRCHRWRNAGRQKPQVATNCNPSQPFVQLQNQWLFLARRGRAAKAGQGGLPGRECTKHDRKGQTAVPQAAAVGDPRARVTDTGDKSASGVPLQHRAIPPYSCLASGSSQDERWMGATTGVLLASCRCVFTESCVEAGPG